MQPIPWPTRPRTCWSSQRGVVASGVRQSLEHTKFPCRVGNFLAVEVRLRQEPTDTEYRVTFASKWLPCCIKDDRTIGRPDSMFRQKTDPGDVPKSTINQKIAFVLRSGSTKRPSERHDLHESASKRKRPEGRIRAARGTQVPFGRHRSDASELHRDGRRGGPDCDVVRLGTNVDIGNPPPVAPLGAESGDATAGGGRGSGGLG